MKSVIVYRDRYAYSSHPCIVQLADGTWLIAFSSGPLGDDVMHPPDHPRFWNKLIRSTDRGATWSSPQVVPGYTWHGVETPGLAQLSTGDVVLNQWRFRWYPLDTARQMVGSDDPVYYWDRAERDWRPATNAGDFADHRFPYARGDDGAYVHISHDAGRSWPETHRIETDPYLGAFSPHGATELTGGDVLLALGSHSHCRRAASFVVRSSDRAKTWSRPIEAAAGEHMVFSEPSVAPTPTGTLLLMSREERTGYIYQSVSRDAGLSWSTPAQLPLWGYPTQVIGLADGRMCVVYGHRRTPAGIRAAFSDDNGGTWGAELVVRHDLADTANGWNLGYPKAIEYQPGRLFVVYYGEDPEGVTCIQGTFVELDSGG